MYLRLVILALIATSFKWDHVGYLQVMGSATGVALAFGEHSIIPALP